MSSQDTWRLLITPPAHGAWNMAVDEAILGAVVSRVSLPTLRLYSWDPACLSLGFAQPVKDVDLALLKERGWEVVRRLTGGRAVLHIDELTYAVIAPADDPRVSGTLLESYQRLAQALVHALDLLSVTVEVNEGQTTLVPKDDNPICFEVPSSYEITVDGKKLVGSAQARRKNGVLQHGSLPLTGDLSRIVQVLSFPEKKERQLAAERLLKRATTLENALGRKVAWEEASQAITAAFTKTLALDLHTEELSLEERDRAELLVKSKYGHSSWTYK